MINPNEYSDLTAINFLEENTSVEETTHVSMHTQLISPEKIKERDVIK